jgi:hypothetical protein
MAENAKPAASFIDKLRFDWLSMAQVIKTSSDAYESRRETRFD